MGKVWIAVIIVIAANAVGWFVFWKMDQRVKMKEREANIASISLRQKLAEWSDRGDDRILLVPENIGEYHSRFKTGCEEEFNFNPPTTEAIYRNRERGISLKIPYNPQWGSKTFKILPFDERDGKVSFGPISFAEGCTWIREYEINFFEQRSVDKIMSDVVAGDTPEGELPVFKKINNIELVESVMTDGLCGQGSIEVVGRKTNYTISTFCGGSESFPILEDIVSNTEFIK